MARSKRRKAAQAETNAASAKEKPFHRPFSGLADLRKKMNEDETLSRKAAPVRSVATPIVETEENLFSRAMSGVKPLEDRTRVRTPEPVEHERVKHPPPTEDEEAFMELAEFVAGQGPFDIVDTDEHVEGMVTGLDPRILRRLRGGHYSVASHVDLHGRTRDEARDLLARFINDARRQGKRCVLIIHGRGLHSKEQRPVLKEAVVSWLGRSSLRKQILAFCSARPYDGGAGALYVLLRR